MEKIISDKNESTSVVVAPFLPLKNKCYDTITMIEFFLLQPTSMTATPHILRKVANNEK